MSFFEMEPIAYVVDRFKDVKKSSEGFVKGVFRRHSENSSHQSPIEILKRLQREGFSDLMKLRDRQEKVERILSFYKSSRGSPFQEVNTHMRGIVDVAGALMFIEGDHQQACNRLDKAGRGIGINSKFIFETLVRQKDALTAEFVTSQDSIGYLGRVLGNPLVLEKVKYLANVNDQLSVVSVPLGARCNDFEIDSALPKELSPFGPPLFNQWHDCAAGLVAKGSKLDASFAGLLSNMGTAIDASDNRIYMSTFGQLTYHLSEEMRFNLSGLWQIPRKASHPMKFGPLAIIPLGSSRQTTGSEAQAAASHSSIPIEAIDYSYAVMLESIFDESTKLKAWFEVQKSSAGSVHLGISLSDYPEDELGWGFKAARKVDGDFSQSHLEAFLNFNLGKRCNFQSGLVCAMDGNGRTPALFFRSSWFM